MCEIVWHLVELPLEPLDITQICLSYKTQKVMEGELNLQRHFEIQQFS